jgi:prephenate dehydrogenase
MWQDIFLTNKKNILKALAEFEKKIIGLTKNINKQK